MLFANYLVPLLPIASALSLHGLARRTHQTLAVRLSGPAASPAAEKRSVLVAPKGSKAKRLVRKTVKARACKPKNPAPAANTTIGNGYNAGPAPASSTTASPAAKPTSNSGWYKTDDWSGNTFFDNFDFWSYDDPTHGTVDYQDAGQSWDQGLVSTNTRGHAVMKVDTTQHIGGRGRKSVRLHGKKVFNGGLVLFDAWHMPTGCGSWPAWWMNGPNWPYGGEIDILEGVNEFSQNQVSIHTGSGCRIPWNTNDIQTASLTTGGFDSYNCASYETANQGCGSRDLKSGVSYGKPFNDIGGGVYAMMWAKNGIRVWFFPRYAIPADINADSPNPDAWGLPMATFTNEICDPYKFFKDNFNIINTTFCGDWAGADGIWNYAGFAGQDRSCAAITGYNTCDDYVRNNGGKFTEAFWEISYVKYYSHPTLV